MKRGSIIFISMVILLGCDTKDEIVSPLSENNRITITYGTFKSVNNIWQIVEFMNQDTISLAELGSTGKISLTINEPDFDYYSYLDDNSSTFSSFSVRLITSAEMEVVVIGGEASLFGIGYLNPGASIDFIIPVTVGQTPIKENNVLDLPNISNSEMFIMYSSPWSSLSIIDTLFLK